MYTFDKKVLFSDIDHTSKMSISGILNAMQDCVNVNSESIGRGIEYMMQNKRTWFAVSWNIEIKRRPSMFEDITVKTWPYDFSSVMGFRNVIITDSNGEDILCADSVWSLVDMETGRPVKIEEEDAKGYDLEERYPMAPTSRKIKVPKEFEFVEEYSVRRADIDYNGHMSNGQYIKIAEEATPFDMEVEQIRVEYKNQAKYMEKLIVERAEILDTEVKEELLSVSAKKHFVIKISGAEHNDVKAIIEIR